MTGLLTARVLSDHFDHVTIIEKLFPGFTNDLFAAGAPTALWGRDNRFYTLGGWTQSFDSGIVSSVCARAELEWLLRRRVSAIQNVEILTEGDVQQLIAGDDGASVVGVSIESRRDHSAENRVANLVVDASGRASKASQWLEQLGYPVPEETVIDAHCGYATRWYEDGDMGGLVAIGIQPQPNNGQHRGGAILEVQRKQWVVTLVGANGDYPPTDEEGFLEFARSMVSSTVYDFIKGARPISPIYGYRKLDNRMRHYERLARRPENFIVIGDAACAFNPIYGQGMSSAAMEAEELGKLLEAYRGRELAGLAARFQKRLFQLVQGPWLISTSEDMRYPGVEGGHASLLIRFSHHYFDLMSRAIPYDNTLSLAFMQTMNLLRPSQSLLYPHFALRVLWHTLFRKPTASKTPRELQSVPIA
jgi:hypothetical protein